MSKDEGLKGKYYVERVDGKPIGPNGCIVLEFDDPRAWPALNKWSLTMKEEGYHQLAEDVQIKLKKAMANREGRQ